MPSRESSRASAGGLAVALGDALHDRGGLWFGWSGKTDPGEPFVPRLVEDGALTYAVVDLDRRDLDDYYGGFANSALWPICHYRLDLLQVNRRHSEAYFRVNEGFARVLAPMLREDDLVWVHDYHFIPLGAALRDLGVRNRIGFFLHIPWPPTDVTSALPSHRRLYEAFGAYDVVGFQTPQDAENLATGLSRTGLGRPLGGDDFDIAGRRVRVGAFPISIDAQEFAATARAAQRTSLVKRMRDSLNDRDLIIGVDRLDYTKGLKERIEAFSCFVRDNPEYRNAVTFLQITPKSRSDVAEYKAMQRAIAEQVGWTNGNLAEVDWTPIRYINETLGRTTIAGLLRLARVGLVTPLRDGMNLVAKEYVAAQDAEDPGVLVLSKFAGAAHELDAALIVNPYDSEGTGRQIATALAMPLDERKQRWSTMMEHLERHGVNAWRDSFLLALERPPLVRPLVAAAVAG